MNIPSSQAPSSKSIQTAGFGVVDCFQRRSSRDAKCHHYKKKKKYGPVIPVAVIAHQTLILELPLSCSRTTWGYMLPGWHGCLFTRPRALKVTSSLKNVRQSVLSSRCSPKRCYRHYHEQLCRQGTGPVWCRLVHSKIMIQDSSHRCQGGYHSVLNRLVNLLGLHKKASPVAAMFSRDWPIRGRRLFPL